MCVFMGGKIRQTEGDRSSAHLPTQENGDRHACRCIPWLKDFGDERWIE